MAAWGNALGAGVIAASAYGVTGAAATMVGDTRKRYAPVHVGMAGTMYAGSKVAGAAKRVSRR